MVKKRNNIGGLLDNLKSDNDTSDIVDTNPILSLSRKPSNPAIGLATNDTVRRAPSVKEPVLNLTHDQVKIFKYHDRHTSTLDTVKVMQIRRSIESEGQHFPGIVRKTNDVTLDGRMVYELVAGRLRYEASRGIGVFKAFLKDLDDGEAAKVMFAENEDRQDITPFERWLSIRPLLRDKVLESKEIAELIGWDPGNLSRSLKATRVYDECKLEHYLKDVSKVKLNVLLELAKLYDSDKLKVQEAISFISDNYSGRRDNLFLKSVIKMVREERASDSETLYLEGSKVKIKKVGDALTLSFVGLPNEAQFSTIIAKLRELKALN